MICGKNIIFSALVLKF